MHLDVELDAMVCYRMNFDELPTYAKVIERLDEFDIAYVLVYTPAPVWVCLNAVAEEKVLFAYLQLRTTMEEPTEAVQEWVDDNIETLNAQYVQATTTGKTSFAARVPDDWELEHFGAFLSITANMFEKIVCYQFNDKYHLVYLQIPST